MFSCFSPLTLYQFINFAVYETIVGRISKYIESIDVLDEVDIGQVAPSKFSMRTELGNIEELMESIKREGLLQPIIVRPSNGKFEIIAGHRRFEACRKLRLKRIKCLVIEASDKEAFEIALIENLQRESLDPIEEAMAYKKYVEEYGWGSITELSKKIGKSPEYISHRISLLRLPSEVLDLLRYHKIKPSTAQELVWVDDPEKQKEIARLVSNGKLTVREIRELIKGSKEALDAYKFGERPDNLKRRLRAIDKAILFFRMALVRLDSLINGLQDFPEIKEKFMRYRITINEIISELMKEKKKYEKTTRVEIR